MSFNYFDLVLKKRTAKGEFNLFLNKKILLLICLILSIQLVFAQAVSVNLDPDLSVANTYIEYVVDEYPYEVRNAYDGSCGSGTLEVDIWSLDTLTWKWTPVELVTQSCDGPCEIIYDTSTLPPGNYDFYTYISGASCWDWAEVTFYNGGGDPSVQPPIGLEVNWTIDGTPYEPFQIIDGSWHYPQYIPVADGEFDIVFDFNPIAYTIPDGTIAEVQVQLYDGANWGYVYDKTVMGTVTSNNIHAEFDVGQPGGSTYYTYVYVSLYNPLWSDNGSYGYELTEDLYIDQIAPLNGITGRITGGAPFLGIGDCAPNLYPGQEQGNCIFSEDPSIGYFEPIDEGETFYVLAFNEVTGLPYGPVAEFSEHFDITPLGAPSKVSCDGDILVYAFSRYPDLSPENYEMSVKVTPGYCAGDTITLGWNIYNYATGYFTENYEGIVEFPSSYTIEDILAIPEPWGIWTAMCSKTFLGIGDDVVAHIIVTDSEGNILYEESDIPVTTNNNVNVTSIKTILAGLSTEDAEELLENGITITITCTGAPPILLVDLFNNSTPTMSCSTPTMQWTPGTPVTYTFTKGTSTVTPTTTPTTTPTDSGSTSGADVTSVATFTGVEAEYDLDTRTYSLLETDAHGAFKFVIGPPAGQRIDGTQRYRLEVWGLDDIITMITVTLNSIKQSREVIVPFYGDAGQYKIVIHSLDKLQGYPQEVNLNIIDVEGVTPSLEMEEAEEVLIRIDKDALLKGNENKVTVMLDGKLYSGPVTLETPTGLSLSLEAKSGKVTIPGIHTKNVGVYNVSIPEKGLVVSFNVLEELKQRLTVGLEAIFSEKVVAGDPVEIRFYKTLGDTKVPLANKSLTITNTTAAPQTLLTNQRGELILVPPHAGNYTISDAEGNLKISFEALSKPTIAEDLQETGHGNLALLVFIGIIVLIALYLGTQKIK